MSDVHRTQLSPTHTCHQHTPVTEQSNVFFCQTCFSEGTENEQILFTVIVRCQDKDTEMHTCMYVHMHSPHIYKYIYTLYVQLDVQLQQYELKLNVDYHYPTSFHCTGQLTTILSNVTIHDILSICRGKLRLIQI